MIKIITISISLNFFYHFYDLGNIKLLLICELCDKLS